MQLAENSSILSASDIAHKLGQGLHALLRPLPAQIPLLKNILSILCFQLDLNSASLEELLNHLTSTSKPQLSIISCAICMVY